jgi:sugar lactone lactonase YvrE
MKVLVLLTITFSIAAALCSAQKLGYAVTTVAGSYPLGDGGPAVSALLSGPVSAIPDRSGNLFILDAANSRIRKVTPDGRISTLLQDPTLGVDMKIAPDGTIYYVTLNFSVNKIALGGSPQRFAGNFQSNSAGDNGLAVNAGLTSPSRLAVDSQGNVYISDGNKIRKVDPSGIIHTIAGTDAAGFGGDGGPASLASFHQVGALFPDQSGNLYVADVLNFRIRKISSNGMITTIAGTGPGLYKAGPATAVPLAYIEGLSGDASGNLFAADGDSAILKITPNGFLSAVAGNFNPYAPSADGPALNAGLGMPYAISTDTAGNLYIVDDFHNSIRKLPPDGKVATVAGRTHDGGDGGPATSAILQIPVDVALDTKGNLYIADRNNYRIRKVDSHGAISTYAGNGAPGYPTDGSSAAGTTIFHPSRLDTDAAGSLYFNDESADVRKITPDGIIHVIVANGHGPNPQNPGHPLFTGLDGIVVDSHGNIFVADLGANRIFKISPTGTVTRWAGSSSGIAWVDGVTATTVPLNFFAAAPLAIDAADNLYVAENLFGYIRKITPAGITATVAGPTGLLRAIHPVDGQSANVPEIGARGLAASANGDIYFSSLYTDEVFRISNGVLHRIAGDGRLVPAGPPDDSTILLDGFGLKVDSQGSVYVADAENNLIRKISLSTPSLLTIVSGNSQSAYTGQQLALPLRVNVANASGVGIAGIPVSFSIASGSAQVSPSVAATDASGLVSVTVQLGSTPGPISITVSVQGGSAPPATFAATAVALGSACPVQAP